MSQSLIEQVHADFASASVPLEMRYGALSMALVYITLVAGFPAVLIGFEWYKAGLSLADVLASACVSCFIFLCYSVLASYVGARTGLNFGLLTRRRFGIIGSKTISFLQTFLFLLWFSLIAVFVAEAIKGLFPSPVPTAVFAFAAALVMGANNLFGFSGVANFARYVASPIMIAWISFVFLKAVINAPHMVLAEPGRVSFLYALSLVSSFTIGYAVWGNEPDFWRFGKPKLSATVWPIALSVVIGQIIFPVSGWMMARMSGITDPAAATGLINQYAFGGIPLIAAAVLAAIYFATGDANLYGAINAVENLRSLPRRKLVLCAMLFSAVCAAGLAYCRNAFEVVASFNSVILPCVMLIVATEFVLTGGKEGYDPDEPVQHGVLNWTAMISVLAGWAVGLATAGIFPCMRQFHAGIWPLYSWSTSAVVYLGLRQFGNLPARSRNPVVLEAEVD